MTTTTRVPEYPWQQLGLEPDPHAALRDLRARSPIVRGGPAVWLVTRHAEVAALLRDSRLGHDLPPEYMRVVAGDGDFLELNDRVLLNRDEPDHTRLRRLVSKAFRTAHIQRLREHVGALVDELLEPALDGAPFDVVSDLARPLPVRVICELLGLPRTEWRLVARVAGDLQSDDFATNDGATRWLRGYVGDALSATVPDEDGDLLQRMLAAEDGGDTLTHDEAVDNLILLFFAGFETTTHLIAAGAAALLHDGVQRDRLFADPGLAAPAVEEFVRFDGPVGQVPRLTLEPLELGGVTVKANRVLMLQLASANRDERVFAIPDEVDVTRSPNPHLGFGGGIHHCLGNQLARTEGQVVFERIAQRCTSFEPAGPVQRLPARARTYLSVPALVRAA